MRGTPHLVVSMSLLRALPALICVGLIGVGPTACKKDPTPVAQPGPDGAPASAMAIQALLGARHRDDLPDRKTLDKHDDAHAALLWIAESGHRAILKNRATELLGLYPDYVDVHADTLDRYAGEDAPHAFIRTAALKAWAKHPPEVRQARVTTFEAAIRSEDPRVKQAGHAALRGLTRSAPLE